MQGTLKYPFSRMGIRNCPACSWGGGDLQVAPSVSVTVGEDELRLLRYVCQYCGYTMLFDMELAKRRPRQRSDGYSEVFPEDA